MTVGVAAEREPVRETGRAAARPETLSDVLQESREYGDRDYLVYRGERLGFATHYAQVAAFAGALQSRYGVGPRGRVAIAMRNYPEFSIAFWATQLIGAVAVPFNAWWQGAELGTALSHARPAVLVVDDERLDRLLSAGVELPPTVTVRTGRRPDTTPLEELVAAGHEPEPVAVGADWDSTVLYTSGSTGRPRGAVHTHRNHVFNLLSTVAEGAEVPRPRDPALLATMPLFHISQLSSLYICAFGGQRLVLMYKWDADTAARLLVEERITAVNGVPVQISGLLDAVRARGAAVPDLAAVGVGAAAVPPRLVHRIREELGPGVRISTGYGMTEATSSLSSIAGEEYLRHPDSVGRPRPGCEVRVVGSDGQNVPTGRVGELWVRGPNVVREYLGDPEATAEAFPDGWHRSGDLVRLDEDGRIYIVDRLKDVVIRAGENVYCVEVEGALAEHPAVRAAVVVGLPHEELGEEVAALVRVPPGAEVTPADLQRHLAERLAAFKVPSHIVLTADELPRTATGKALKHEVRERLTSRAKGEPVSVTAPGDAAAAHGG